MENYTTPPRGLLPDPSIPWFWRRANETATPGTLPKVSGVWVLGYNANPCAGTPDSQAPALSSTIPRTIFSTSAATGSIPFPGKKLPMTPGRRALRKVWPSFV